MVLPVVGALCVKSAIFGSVITLAGMTDVGRKVVGSIFEGVGGAIKWIGEKIKPGDEKAETLKLAVGELLIKLKLAEEEGRISPERRKEIMEGLTRYLIDSGIKSEDVYNYMGDAIVKRRGADLSPDEEDTLEKEIAGVLDRIEKDAMDSRMKRGQGLSI